MTNKRFEEWAGDTGSFNLYAEGLKPRTVAEVAFIHGYVIGQKDFRARAAEMLRELLKHIDESNYAEYAAKVIENLVIE